LSRSTALILILYLIGEAFIALQNCYQLQQRRKSRE
jgi:hypothetical protein